LSEDIICRRLGWGSGTETQKAGKASLRSILISHESLLWKFHSLLAGIHGTRPCGSPHPSAGGSTGLHGEKRQPVQPTEVKGPAMAGHTGSPPSKQLLRCVKQLELQKTFSRNSKSVIQGLCFAPSVSIPLNGCPHARQSSAFTLLRRVHFQNPTFFGSKK
ncbi:hypothetical protein AVEN_180240-1, partial [Araneus ventricosus]